MRFPIVINTNLPPILHLFGDIAVDRSKIATPLAFNSPDGGVPWDDLCKISSGCQWMAMVPNGVEKLWKISTGWVGCTNVTDRRQTTDGRATAYSEREGEFTFAKNHTSKLHETFCTVLVLIVVVAMTTVRVMYFLFCGWRHVCPYSRPGKADASNARILNTK